MTQREPDGPRKVEPRDEKGDRLLTRCWVQPLLKPPHCFSVPQMCTMESCVCDCCLFSVVWLEILPGTTERSLTHTLSSLNFICWLCRLPPFLTRHIQTAPSQRGLPTETAPGSLLSPNPLPPDQARTPPKMPHTLRELQMI